MVRLTNIAAGLSLASVALSSPLQGQLYTGQNASTPCAQVSASVAAQKTVATPTVAARLAYECITSVPFNQTAALALVDGVVPYFKWQSNTAFVKDPPEECAEKVQPAVDIWGGLEKIRGKVVGGQYENEFEFGFELYILIQSAHDGHFVYVPDVVGTVFNFARPVPLVSVSADGKELPKAYVYADVLAELFGNSTFTSSPISKINGEDAQAFLENWAQYGSLQDRDALYNNVFYELATVSLGPSGSGVGTFAGSGRGRLIYPGATTELEFENGTSVTYDNYAKVLIPFTGITDGESLYKTWFTGNQPTAATPTPSPSSKPIPAPGYPPPVLREAHNLIGGYYLEDDYADVAVLSLPSFVGINTSEAFQDTAAKFLAAAKAAGKKKLVVDVSANAGGTILLGYDLYKLLFPNDVDHAAYDRFRAFESTDLLGQKLSDTAEGLPRQLVTKKQNETLYELNDAVVASLFNYQTDVSVNGTNFVNWADKFGPIVHEKGDNFSNLFRWNLSDPLIPLQSGGVYIHGYGPLSNYTQQPFAAEDVVVVTDGYCASTCTIFSELMRQRAGVKYISLGGRPREGITQAVGGVKGTNNFPWPYIQSAVQFAVNNLTSSAEEAAKLNSTEFSEYWSDTVFDRVAIGSSINVNFRDGIRDGDETYTPLHFVYEASDCRILYTKQMTVDATAIWKAVADSTWGGKSHCIAGDLGGYSTGSKLGKRELTVQDKVLSRSMHQWRRELREQDYPLDVFTDLRKAKLGGDGIMWP
ncbi:serine-type peptidase [Ascochyta rabiei]|uniref:Serine-type peptidase n=1 Tax=Didymella rabiei TaxID=5454 RepID=A0A162Y8K3_DIDRA|nr:serine-type peptidase [Ascochyta rabiei]